MFPAPHPLHLVCGFIRRHMFPKSENRPPLILQAVSVSQVSLDIPLQLRSPPIMIILRNCSVIRATVPKTTIHKYRYFCPCENNIRLGFQHLVVNPESHSSSKQLSTQKHLRFRIFRGHPLHLQTNVCVQWLRTLIHIPSLKKKLDQ